MVSQLKVLVQLWRMGMASRKESKRFVVAIHRMSSLHHLLVVARTGSGVSMKKLARCVWTFHHVHLVDADARFQERGKKERLMLFTDLAHLSAKGNELLAEVVQDSLRRGSLLKCGPR